MDSRDPFQSFGGGPLPAERGEVHFAQHFIFPVRQRAENVGSRFRDFVGPQRGVVGADDLLDG